MIHNLKKKTNVHLLVLHLTNQLMTCRLEQDADFCQHYHPKPCSFINKASQISQQCLLPWG